MKKWPCKRLNSLEGENLKVCFSVTVYLIRDVVFGEIDLTL